MSLLNPVITPAALNTAKIEAGILTFGGLIKLKREKMKYTLQEVVDRTEVFNLSQIERDLCTPREATMAKLVKFYNLTQEEVRNCRKADKIPKIVSQQPKAAQSKAQPASISNAEVHEEPKKPAKPISAVIALIDTIIEDMNAMDDSGSMAKKLKIEGLDHMMSARELIQDVVILEKLI